MEPFYFLTNSYKQETPMESNIRFTSVSHSLRQEHSVYSKPNFYKQVTPME